VDNRMVSPVCETGRRRIDVGPRSPGPHMSQALAPAPLPSSPPPVRGRLDEEAKRSFLRMISHELRTPLNSIIGFSEVLRQELCGPLGSAQYKEYANFISGSGHKMLKLVNQIVEIVRLESHAEEMDLRPEPLDLALGEAFQALAAESQSWGVKLVAEDLDDMPSALADARGLRTVLINLLQNAMAHSPAGDIVRARAFRRGGLVLVEIRLQRAGRAPEQVHRSHVRQSKDRICGHDQIAMLSRPVIGPLWKPSRAFSAIRPSCSTQLARRRATYACSRFSLV